MRIEENPLDDQKPVADLQEQERPDLEEPDDPEAPALGTPDFAHSDANPADVAEQQEEVPLDDDGRDGIREDPMQD